MSTTTGRRIYLGRLPPDVRKADVEEFFAPIKFTDCRIMGAFGFVEFGDSRDADDAVRDGANKKLMNTEIIVEKAKDNNRERRAPPPSGGGGGYGDSYYAPRDSAPPARRGPAPGRGIRVLVKGLTPDISWQDLKDFGREGGAVIYADVNRAGEGVLEYQTIGEAETALDRLSAVDIKGLKPNVSIDDPRGGGGGGGRGGDRGYDRDPYYRDRRSPPRSSGGGGGYGGDRDRDRRGGGDYDRRERDRSPRRDRSPPRRDYDRDSRRSPPREYRRGDDRE